MSPMLLVFMVVKLPGKKKQTDMGLFNPSYVFSTHFACLATFRLSPWIDWPDPKVVPIEIYNIWWFSPLYSHYFSILLEIYWENHQNMVMTSNNSPLVHGGNAWREHIPSTKYFGVSDSETSLSIPQGLDVPENSNQQSPRFGVWFLVNNCSLLKDITEARSI